MSQSYPGLRSLDTHENYYSKSIHPRTILVFGVNKTSPFHNSSNTLYFTSKSSTVVNFIRCLRDTFETSSSPFGFESPEIYPSRFSSWVDPRGQVLVLQSRSRLSSYRGSYTDIQKKTSSLYRSIDLIGINCVDMILLINGVS